jgi:NADH-quinone oxidoreductase subunit A
MQRTAGGERTGVGGSPLPAMLFDYLNVLVFVAVGFVFVMANLVIGSFIRPKRRGTDGLETYECGEETIGDTWIQFDIRYYTVALIYVIFAVEIAFLFPWAMVLKRAFETPEIGLWALAKGFLFVTILFFGLIAVWAKGDLDWILTWSKESYIPTGRREGSTIPPLAVIDRDEESEEGSEEEAA